MTSHSDLPKKSPQHSSEPADLPPSVLEEIQSLVASLLESGHPIPSLDDLHISASEFDALTAPSIRAAWLITIVDQTSRSIAASTVIFEPRKGEVAA